VKLLSNALFLASVALLVAAAATGNEILYTLAAFAFVGSFLVTVVKRRQFRARKATAPHP
jgi:hypothetical protein